jgi:hypothetical protein
MDINELYERYMTAYKIEIRECETPYSVDLLRDIDMLENLTIDEFKDKLKNPTFNNKWGDEPNNSSNFMYNWIRDKSGK